MMKPSLRVLLVEDDPVSAAYLSQAAATLPAQVEVAADAAQAVQRAQAGGHALWLIDAHLPDASGIALLAQLRAVQPQVPALAHTASRDAGLHAQLREAGFIDVLIKPLDVATLLDALRHALRLPPPAAHGGKHPNWDDAAAIAALGQPAHVRTMRQLFLAELPGQLLRITQAFDAGNGDAARGELHRLIASCGFVGAPRLAAAVRALHEDPRDAAALARLREAAAHLVSVD